MNDDQLKQKKVYIPRSIVQFGKIKGFSQQNWIEAIAFTILVELILLMIPFVFVIKIVSCIVLGIFTFYISLKGIKQRSLLQIFFASIRHRKRKRFYVRRRLSDDTKKIASTYKIGKKSFFERLADRIDEIGEKVEENRKY